MAFEGDLSQLKLGDVLQTIAMSRQVGTFVLKGRGDQRHLACTTKGVALLTMRKSLGLKIGAVLVGSGKVQDADLEAALKLQARRRELLIGEALVELGACSVDDVRSARRYLAAEEIFDLFTWTSGQFEFIDQEPETTGPFADLWFDVASLAMEAARRSDELPRLLEIVPADEVYVPAESGRLKRQGALTNRDISQLFAMLDVGRTVEDVQETYHRGRFDTIKGLVTLLEAGVVRPATLAEILAAGHAAANAGDPARAARLYRRVLRGDDANDDALFALADALAAAGDRAAASDELVRSGARRLAAGDPDAAIHHLGRALDLQPSNSTANEGLAHAFAAAGRSDEAADAALAAARTRLNESDYEGAARVAETGLGLRAGDTNLIVAYANALHALGHTPDALARLAEAASLLAEETDRRDAYAEVLRRIVQIDPENKDAAARLKELVAVGATRRKKLLRRLAAAAGVLVLATAAVPFVRGPSPRERMEKALELADAGSPAEAAELLAAIDDASLDEDTLFEKSALDKRVDALLHPSAGAAMRREFAAHVDDLNKAALDRFGRDESVADGLAAAQKLLDYLEGPEANAVIAAGPAEFAKVREVACGHVHAAIAHSAVLAQSIAARVTAARDRFSDDVWRREDIDLLRELVSGSEAALGVAAPERWEPVPGLAERLVSRAGTPKDGCDRVLVDNVAALLEAYRKVSADHDRAVSRVRRKELKESYKAAYSTGTQLEREGRIEEAVARYDEFLVRCDELRNAEPEALYAPIARELFGNEMQLDRRIRASRDRLAGVLRDISAAERAEAEDDTENAFRIRRTLVVENADLDFAKRFRFPMRVETAPPGAEVVLMDGTPGGRVLGTTPLVTAYPIRSPAKWEVRLAGYRAHEITRTGTADDASGVERIDLPKIAEWVSRGGGASESSPVAVAGGWLVASRTGVIRRVNAATGADTARFAPHLLAGFAAAPVARDGLVFAASLDGTGYVLRADDLTQVATFTTGPVRSALAAAGDGVVVADENGDVRLVDAAGAVRWTRHLGRIRTDATQVRDGLLYVTGEPEAVVLDPASGEVLRRRALASETTWGAPSSRGQRVFVGSESGAVVCLDASTLREVWTQEVGGPVRCRVGAFGPRVVACTANGTVLLLDEESGAILSKVLTGGKIDASPCELADGGFVVVTQKGSVTRFDAKCGLVWKFDTGEDVSAPAAGSGRSVLVVTRKGSAVSLAD